MDTVQLFTVAGDTLVTEQFFNYISKFLYTIGNSSFSYVDMVQVPLEHAVVKFLF